MQVEDLARLSFKRKPLYVGIDDSKAVATREGLEQVSVVKGGGWGTLELVSIIDAKGVLGPVLTSVKLIMLHPGCCRGTAWCPPTSASCCCSPSSRRT